MQTLQTGTGLSQQNQANEKGQQRLETLFRAVDMIKSDLTKCGKGMPESKQPLFECSSNHFSVRFKQKSLQKVSYRLDPDEKTLTRQVNRQRAEVLLEGVTDFYVTHFPESKSVLYRIEINGKEQIRGYVFLVNMAN